MEEYKEKLQNLNDNEIISQGAEAILYKTIINDKEMIIKHRFPKSYRDPTLDKTLNKKRATNEMKILQKMNELQIPSPHLYYSQNLDIIMEFIHGDTLKKYINDNQTKNENQETNQHYTQECFDVMISLGKTIGKIHSLGYIHGDLTTSNFMITKETMEIVIIDFGLTMKSETTENRAVDLYVLERALLCTHYHSDDLFNAILNGYRESFDKAEEVLKHLNEVRLRGRKKDMSG